MLPTLNPTTLPRHPHLSTADLREAGYAILDSFLEPHVVRQTHDGLAALGEDAQASRVRRGVTFARRNLLNEPCVRSLIEGPAVRALLDEVGAGLVPVRAILFDKTGAANWTVPWHQDRSIAVKERIDSPGYGPWSHKAGVVHVQPPIAVLQQMLTVRFSLDACDASNGPLRVIAGTHVRLLDPAEVEHIAATQAQTFCTTSAGGLVVMRPLILHASSPAATASHRRVLHVEFGPASLPGGVRWAWA